MEGKKELAEPEFKLSEMIALVCHFYPGTPFWSPQWETKDGTMPWHIFAMLYRGIDIIEARQRVNIALATVTSGAAVHSVEEGQKTAQKQIKDWITEAYPESYRKK